MNNNYLEVTRKQALEHYLTGKTIYVCAIGFNPDDDIEVCEFSNHYGIKENSQIRKFYRITRDLTNIFHGISIYIENKEN